MKRPKWSYINGLCELIMKDRRKKICIITEGSYPYITGGVSAWVQDIISGCSGFDFILYAISADEDNEVKYKLPENVIGLFDRFLVGPSKTGKQSVDRKYFEMIKPMHESFMKTDFSHLRRLVGHMQANRYSHEELTQHRESWKMANHYGNLHNPLYPFSDYYWSWIASHEYLFKILTWDIPEADLYHTISTGYAGLTAAVAKIVHKKPVILTEHGLYNKEREIDIKRATWVKGYQRDLWINIFNDLSRITYDYSDLTISLFEHNRNIQISQGAAREKTMVIPNGIDIDRYLDLKQKKKEDFSVGFVGRVVPIKDVKNFIIAAKVVSEEMDNVKFYIIGPQDEDEKYMEECLQLVANFKLEDSVMFTGRADVREYYSFLDVIVLSSIREAQPLVILEAYAAGIPVVSTRVGNVPEMVGYDEKLLADPKDSEKLAGGILELSKNSDYYEKLVKKNRNKVLKYYNKKDLIKIYSRLYNRYIDEAAL